MMADAAAKKRGIMLFDLISAFRNRKQPQDLEDGTGRVCLLRRSLSSRSYLSSHPTIRESSEIMKSPWCWEFIWRMAEDSALAKRLLMHLKKVFQVTSGTYGQFLGMKVTVNKDSFVIIQPMLGGF